MKWNPRIQQILDTLASHHPTWVADDSGPAPTPRYKLNEKFAQQVCFEFGAAYGLKRADRGRPISSENLAKLEPNGRLIAWAWEDKHNGEWEQFPEGEDITGQVFVPVPGINHLSALPEPQPEPEPDPGNGGDGEEPDVAQALLAILENQNLLVAQLETATKRLENVAALVSVVELANETNKRILELLEIKMNRPLVGSFFGAKIVLRPQD
jgi:hypothetical protein